MTDIDDQISKLLNPLRDVFEQVDDHYHKSVWMRKEGCWLANVTKLAISDETLWFYKQLTQLKYADEKAVHEFLVELFKKTHRPCKSEDKYDFSVVSDGLRRAQEQLPKLSELLGIVPSDNLSAKAEAAEPTTNVETTFPKTRALIFSASNKDMQDRQQHFYRDNNETIENAKALGAVIALAVAIALISGTGIGALAAVGIGIVAAFVVGAIYMKTAVAWYKSQWHEDVAEAWENEEAFLNEEMSVLPALVKQSKERNLKAAENAGNAQAPTSRDLFAGPTVTPGLQKFRGASSSTGAAGSVDDNNLATDVSATETTGSNPQKPGRRSHSPHRK